MATKADPGADLAADEASEAAGRADVASCCDAAPETVSRADLTSHADVLVVARPTEGAGRADVACIADVVSYDIVFAVVVLAARGALVGKGAVVRMAV